MPTRAQRHSSDTSTASFPWSAAIGTAATSIVYLVAWVAPNLRLELTESLITAFFLEFFIVHAGLMVPAARSMHPSKGYLIASLYLLAGLGIWAGLGLWTFVSFTYLTVIEVLPALRSKGDDLMVTAMTGLGKALLYFVVLVAAVLLPIPRLGVSEAVEAELAIGLEGIADPGPQNILFAGFVFFGILAYVRGLLARGRPTERPRPPATAP